MSFFSLTSFSAAERESDASFSGLKDTIGSQWSHSTYTSPIVERNLNAFRTSLCSLGSGLKKGRLTGVNIVGRSIASPTD
jgi:hypothetical protein